MQGAVGVGQHDQTETGGTKGGEGRRHLVRDRFPQIVRLMIDLQFGERRGRRVAERDAGLGQHEVEIGPAALLIVGRLNRVSGIEPLLRARLGCGEGTGRCGDTVTGQGIADP